MLLLRYRYLKKEFVLNFLLDHRAAPISKSIENNHSMSKIRKCVANLSEAVTLSQTYKKVSLTRVTNTSKHVTNSSFAAEKYLNLVKNEPFLSNF